MPCSGGSCEHGNGPLGSTDLYPRNVSEVSGQLYVPTVLPPGQEPRCKVIRSLDVCLGNHTSVGKGPTLITVKYILTLHVAKETKKINFYYTPAHIT
jgi:hypothetical protein